MEQDNNQNNLDKLASEPIVNEPLKKEYGHSKVLDFILGFFGVYVVGFLINYFLLSANMLFGLNPNLYYFINYPLVWFVLLVLFIIFFNKIKRKYISFGIMWAIIIPLILVGGCFAVFMGSY